MIRFADGEWAALFEGTIGKFGIVGTKRYSQYQTYGTSDGVLDLWLLLEGDRAVGAASRLGGAVTLAADSAADADELAAFLGAVGCRSYEGEQALCERVNAVIRGGLRSSRILRWGGHFPREDARPAAAAPCADGVPPGRVAPAENLGAVYALLCAADPEFAARTDYAAWLTEVSHKRRHGLADVYILEVNNQIVSTIGIYFKGADRAILAGLATDPAWRGRGYARRMMAHAANAALAQGLEPWLLTAEKGVAAFHRACGFVDAGFWSKGNFRESSL